MSEEESEEQLVLTADDFVDSDYIMVRPALVRKLGDLPGVLLIARIQFRSHVQPPDEEGVKWWRATYQDLSDETGLSADQARRTVDRLVSKGLVLAKIDNCNSWDRTRSYRVPICQMHLAIPPHRDGGSARSDVADLPDLLLPKEEQEEEQEEIRALRSVPANGAEKPRPDVEEILKHFNESLIRRGCKPKRRTKADVDAARRLIDTDGLPVAKVKSGIDWAADDQFWAAHILSIAKFREKYQTLRLQYEKSGTSHTAGYKGPYQNPTDLSGYMEAL